MLVDLEGHGREPMADGIDLSRTVGWFTSLYPVRLDVGPIDLDVALGGGAAMGDALKRVKEQLRAIPGRGLGYGLLRYLHAEAGPRLAVPAHAAARLQLPGPVRRRRGRGLVAGRGGDGPGRRAIRRCRWRTWWRSTP